VARKARATPLDAGHKEFDMNTRRAVAAMLVAIACGGTFHAAWAQRPPITRTDLQRHDLSAPGREVVQTRVDFAPGAAFGKHRHPGEEIVYVLEGRLEYQIGSAPPVTLGPGQVLFVPARAVHSAKNVGGGSAAELATYVVEKGKPLLELVK
jgi:quercetin dioxygenase-like cupin family protein